jgi:hypothetical protein
MTMTVPQYDRVEVFSGTRARERVALGDRITEFLENNPAWDVVDVKICQSSDNAFHCLTIVLFLRAVRRRRRRVVA